MCSSSACTSGQPLVLRCRCSRGDTQERNGFFLAAYIIDNSVLQDGFMEGVRTFLDDAVVYKYDSPYQEKDVLEKELMYIIEIKNED